MPIRLFLKIKFDNHFCLAFLFVLVPGILLVFGAWTHFKRRDVLDFILQYLTFFLNWLILSALQINLFVLFLPFFCTLLLEFFEFSIKFLKGRRILGFCQFLKKEDSWVNGLGCGWVLNLTRWFVLLINVIGVCNGVERWETFHLGSFQVWIWLAFFRLKFFEELFWWLASTIKRFFWLLRSLKNTLKISQLLHFELLL